MKIGASTACLYPLETEKSLIALGELGFDIVELFLNSPSELSPEFVRELIKIKECYGMNISSLHPFQSFAESFYLFSNYYRRYTDILPLYERMYEVAEQLGSTCVVYHGAKIPGSLPDEQVFERFKSLTEIGKKYNVNATHENVNLYRSQNPQFLIDMQKYVGENYGVTLDIKQAYRASFNYEDFLTPLHPYIKNIHISDRNNEKDCIPPLQGSFDFAKFFKDILDYGYNGNCIIELYNWSYNNISEIAESKKQLEEILRATDN